LVERILLCMRGPRVERVVPDFTGDAEGDPDEIPMPAVPTVTQRPAETNALLASERLLAASRGSGVRAISVDGDAASDTSGFDLSNAVTRVHRAIELDAFWPPTVEVTVVASPTLSIVEAPDALPLQVIATTRPLGHVRADEPHGASIEPGEVPWPSAPVVASGAPSTLSAMTRNRSRRRLARGVAVGVMVAAFALIGAAVWRGQLRISEPMARAIGQLLHRIR
jgi:hypothetical protein